MHVAAFTDSYEPYVSGVVRSINSFAFELAKLGHSTYIFAPAYPDHWRRGANVFRFYSLPSPTYQSFRLAIPFSPRLRETLQRLECSVIHVHSPFLMGQLGAHCARRLHLPLVFTYHTFYREYSHYVPLGSTLARQLADRWSREFCNRCDTIVAPSESVRRFLVQLGVRTPVEVIPTGVDVGRFAGGDPQWLRRHLRLSSGVPLVLYAGRLGREKNLLLLLAAFASLHARQPDTRLVLVGDGPLRAELADRAAAAGLRDAVLFAGPVPAERMPDCYVGADVFAFPSQTETQGLVVLEAMAAGLPVAVVAGPGAGDVIEHGRDGFLVPPDPGALADALLELLSDPEQRRAMGRAARHKATGHDAGLMARRLEQVYTSLQSTTPRGSRAV